MGLSVEEQRAKIRSGKQPKKVKKKPAKFGREKIRADKIMVQGIYFLYQGKEIVYIGMSETNVMERICSHQKEYIKEFDSFSFEKHKCSIDRLKRLEKSLIKRYKPKYNKVHNAKKRIKFVRS